MSKEAALVIGVPMIIDALSSILNIKKEKLQEYYNDSQAFRDYLNSLTTSLNSDIQNELLQVTPSTTPRFDIPWITDELHKRQNDLFNLKNQITELQTKAHQSAQETWNQSKEKTQADFDQTNNPIKSIFTQNYSNKKKQFYDRKRKEADQYTKDINNLTQKAINIRTKPLINTNPTYQTIQERKKNAQISEKK